ncbi:MAG: 2-C-methyl-D-erythritol 4-phosphate cytidylyltransferase [Propionibacteriaceae bacterium]|nr:2-C-methyl-D-erythritol 4-phosphate cytidylyltransferase [Propionibacteriaceae bacterium]
MHQDIPKQFIHIDDKPVIVYTLEGFERHPKIDAIEVVCIDGWHEMLWAYAKQFGITKLRGIVSGGATAQESIRNGVEALSDVCADDDIVVVHDGIRPMLDSDVLSDVIVTCERHGNGVTSLPYNEQIFIADDDESTTRFIPRETLRRVSTPQAYRFGLLRDRYREAFAKGVGISGSSYTNTMMVELGERLYFAAGSERNIKLTTREDLDLFRAQLHSSHGSWLK